MATFGRLAAVAAATALVPTFITAAGQSGGAGADAVAAFTLRRGRHLA
jgi:hypothetical protein